MDIWTLSATSFWVAVVVLVYTYVGYAALLVLVSIFKNHPVRRGVVKPRVTVIITAYNEERDIQAKLENTLALDYYPNLLEIIVASDCSVDRTDEIVTRFANHGVKLLRQEPRRGKTAAQNAAVEQANGDIILFSDATTFYPPGVLREIIPNFADATVGCVGGRLVYKDPRETVVGSGARTYWEYETFLKTLESKVSSLIGVSGCLYAVRRSAYVPLNNEACSDFIIATKMVEQGLRAVYEPAAICWEETNQKAREELRMRVRVITQTYSDLWRERSMLNPLKSGFYGFQLISHKVMRYAVPVLMVIIFVSSALLALYSLFFAIVFGAQLFAYLLALSGWVLGSVGKRSIFLALPHYFVLANFAAVLAFYQFLRGERYASWETLRESD